MRGRIGSLGPKIQATKIAREHELCATYNSVATCGDRRGTSDRCDWLEAPFGSGLGKRRRTSATARDAPTRGPLLALPLTIAQIDSTKCQESLLANRNAIPSINSTRDARSIICNERLRCIEFLKKISWARNVLRK